MDQDICTWLNQLIVRVVPIVARVNWHPLASVFKNVPSGKKASRVIVPVVSAENEAKTSPLLSLSKTSL